MKHSRSVNRDLLGHSRAARPLPRTATVLAAFGSSATASCAWAQGFPQGQPQNVASIDARDAHGQTALTSAASEGRTDTMRELPAQGAKVDATSSDGRSPLIAAAQKGQLEAARVLIAAGANLNYSSRSGTALAIAEHHGDTQLVNLLAQCAARGADRGERTGLG